MIVNLPTTPESGSNSSGTPLDLGQTLREYGPSSRLALSAVAAFVGQKEVALHAIALESDLLEATYRG